ncbi:SNF2 family N-terminal domain-containing protein, partial [Bombardia bombarda]
HQKQALTFMMQRERGWDYEAASMDYWDYVESTQASFFVNRISGAYQEHEPTQFRGGVVGDPMGLGKSLSMIALVAMDAKGERSRRVSQGDGNVAEPATMPSLVIVPPPLLDSWEEQLSQHVKKGHMTWRRHYDKQKLTELDNLSEIDIVLTTYHTLTAETGARSSSTNKSIMFSTCWKRIILDEAHVIRNPASQMARAMCALEGHSRWAVTGTPIQNRIGDLAALLKFLRVHPYDDPKRFDTDIAKLWKSGDIDEAVRRLKQLSGCLLLRRPKTVISLPTRKDLRFPVEFNLAEREFYDNLKNQALAHIDEACYGETQAYGLSSYINVIQKINALRMICNIGLHYDSRHSLSVTERPNKREYDWSTVAQETFNLQREMDGLVCSGCQSPCDITTTTTDESESQLRPQFTQCLVFTCTSCVQRATHADKPLMCGHSPAHPAASVSLTTEEATGAAITAKNIIMSSKVSALVMQLSALPSDVKCIVFSSWRTTLDLVQVGLDKASILNVRFDGKVPQKQRKSVIDKFKRDPTVRVLLLTLSCGAVGLTLTEASRAYLMEPHWNPTIEEQALARIHRLGQKKEVTTVRFYVKDTFEERVLELQESKKQLEEVLLEHNGKQQTDSR